MATTVSHAMRRFPTTTPDTKYNSYSPIRSTSSGSGSALSRSMRYAEPWLYGSVRGTPLLLVQPVPLCACADYVCGTKRSSKSASTCKTCHGTRLPLDRSAGSVKAKYGTVRGYPTSPPPTLQPSRAGTLRVTNSSRPTILPPSPTIDPYDLMRRSRLSCPDVNIGSSQFRARSQSPNKSFKNFTSSSSSSSSSRTKNRPRSPSPGKSVILGRRSILECDVNPYELMSTDGEKKENGVSGRKGRNVEVDYEDIDVGTVRKISQIPKLQNKKKQGTIRHKPTERETQIRKSILKKPSPTFSDPDPLDSSRSVSHAHTHSSSQSSHFYLPMPTLSPQRKRVQFLVESEGDVHVDNARKNSNSSEDTVVLAEADLDLLVAGGREVERCEERVVAVEERERDDREDFDEPCRLKRSLSERLGQGTPAVSFNDTMALRTSRSRASVVDGGSNLFDAVTDLQRLDGIGPARPRPREPPPPPPPPSCSPPPPPTQERAATPPPRAATEMIGGYDVAITRENNQRKTSKEKDVDNSKKNSLENNKKEKKNQQEDNKKNGKEVEKKQDNNKKNIGEKQARRVSFDQTSDVQIIDKKSSDKQNRKVSFEEEIQVYEENSNNPQMYNDQQLHNGQQIYNDQQIYSDLEIYNDQQIYDDEPMYYDEQRDKNNQHRVNNNQQIDINKQTEQNNHNQKENNVKQNLVNNEKICNNVNSKQLENNKQTETNTKNENNQKYNNSKQQVNTEKQNNKEASNNAKQASNNDKPNNSPKIINNKKEIVHKEKPITTNKTNKSITNKANSNDTNIEEAENPPSVPPRKRSNSKQPNTPPIITRKESVQNQYETLTNNTETSKTNDEKSTLDISSKDYEDVFFKTSEVANNDDLAKNKNASEAKESICVTKNNVEFPEPEKYLTESSPTIEKETVIFDTPIITIKSPDYATVNENISSMKIESTDFNYSYQKVKVEPSKTIVQINSPKVQVIPSTVHRLQIKNDFQENSNYNKICISESPQRKTSIMINGDDCYSTVNVNDDVPIYQSSVVVNDFEPRVEIGSNRSSSVYITGDFQSSPLTSRTSKSEERPKKTLVILEGNFSAPSTPNLVNGKSPEVGKTFVVLQDECPTPPAVPSRNSTSISSINQTTNSSRMKSIVSSTNSSINPSTNPSINSPTSSSNTSATNSATKPSTTPSIIPPTNPTKHSSSKLLTNSSTKLSTNLLVNPEKNGKEYEDPYERPSSEELLRLLKDPVEAVKRNLVPHVCGKSDIERKPKNKKQITSNSLVARLLEDPFLGSLAEGLETNTVAKLIEDSLLKLRSQDVQEDDKDSEGESFPPYELMEAGSDCYSNHSNRSSVTEDELGTRSKFYQLLADAALSEIEDHHYECIKPNVDPIYEEIEIPPPLPSNPPPSSIIDDLQIDKQFTTRSIFEGASKYDILSYLVDAKERGIVPEESYTYNFNNSGEVIVEEEEETKRGVFSSRVSHMSTVSDSSEESSLVTVEKNGPQKSAEIERNDSGVGSETSKCSRSRYLSQPETSACEDCDLIVDPQPEDGPLICKKCSKKRSERKETITEIVETEEKYSRDLQIILEEFYQPMLVAGLLTPEQLSAIFLNVEELLENSQALAERLRDTLEIALEQGDEDLLQVNIGKIILEASPMLHAFESYCVRQGPASLLLASLEKEKELLRIFLRVSQMENTVLRRMNLNSFLMVPVQRVTKYPLLLARLYKVTPLHHESRDLLREAQHKIELHLSHMNSETKDVPSKLWRRISNNSGRRSSSEMDLVNIKLRKIAVDVLEWNHDEARFALEGRLLFTQPTDNNWRKGRTIKLTHINALLVTNGKPNSTSKTDRPAITTPTTPNGTSNDDSALTFPRHTGVREAALLLVRDKGGRYSLLREPLYLDRCVIATDPAWQSYFEVQELLSKDTFIFKAEETEMTRTWYRQLQYHAQGMGAWRKRRNALANIMINGMGSRS